MRCDQLLLLDLDNCDEETVTDLKHFVESGCTSRESDQVGYVQVEQAEGSRIIFHSEISHGVATLTEGERTVFVMEFWPLADASADECRPALADGSSQPQMPPNPPDGCVLSNGVYQRACWNF